MSFFVDGVAPHRDIVPPEKSGPWWWACSAPERPADDGWALYASDCDACQIALAALVLRDPDSVLDWHGDGTGIPTDSLTVVEIAERTGVADRWLSGRASER